MFPRSCRLEADSKSNSSTFWPRTTTTRVSSGREASISILFAMTNSRHGDRRRRSLPVARRGLEARYTLAHPGRRRRDGSEAVVDRRRALAGGAPGVDL